MKLKPGNLLAIVLAFVVCAAGIYLFPRGKRPQPNVSNETVQFVPIEPHENADGTVDYTLINKPIKEANGEYWVLRFPKDVLVLPGPFGEKTPGNSFTKGRNANYSIILELKIPSLEPYGASTTFQQRLDGKMLQVEVMASPAPVLSMLKDFQETSAKFCSELGRIEPGVVAFVPKPGLDPESLEGSCFGSSNAKGNSPTYMILDKDQRFLGNIHCARYGDARTPSQNGSACGGYVYINGDRAAMVSWVSVDIDPAHLQSWMLTIASMIERATVRTETVPPNQEYKP